MAFDRTPLNLVIVTDERINTSTVVENLKDAKTNKDMNVSIWRMKRSLSFTFDEGYDEICKHKLFDKGTIFLLCCGIHSFMKKKKLKWCSPGCSMLKYSYDADDVIRSAQKLNQKILKKTNNDLIVFSELVPLDILLVNKCCSDKKNCLKASSFDPKYEREVKEHIIQVLKFNKFTSEHNTTFQFPVVNLLQNCFSSTSLVSKSDIYSKCIGFYFSEILSTKILNNQYKFISDSWTEVYNYNKEFKTYKDMFKALDLTKPAQASYSNVVIVCNPAYKFSNSWINKKVTVVPKIVETEKQLKSLCQIVKKETLILFVFGIEDVCQCCYNCPESTTCEKPLPYISSGKSNNFLLQQLIGNAIECCSMIKKMLPPGCDFKVVQLMPTILIDSDDTAHWKKHFKHEQYKSIYCCFKNDVPFIANCYHKIYRKFLSVSQYCKILLNECDVPLNLEKLLELESSLNGQVTSYSKWEQEFLNQISIHLGEIKPQLTISEVTAENLIFNRQDGYEEENLVVGTNAAKNTDTQNSIANPVVYYNESLPVPVYEYPHLADPSHRNVKEVISELSNDISQNTVVIGPQELLMSVISNLKFKSPDTPKPLFWCLEDPINWITFEMQYLTFSSIAKKCPTIFVVVADVSIMAQMEEDKNCGTHCNLSKDSKLKFYSSASMNANAFEFTKIVNRVQMLTDEVKSKLIIAPLCPRTAVNIPHYQELEDHLYFHRLCKLESVPLFFNGKKDDWTKGVTRFCTKWNILTAKFSDCSIINLDLLLNSFPLLNWQPASIKALSTVSEDCKHWMINFELILRKVLNLPALDIKILTNSLESTSDKNSEHGLLNKNSFYSQPEIMKTASATLDLESQINFSSLKAEEVSMMDLLNTEKEIFEPLPSNEIESCHNVIAKLSAVPIDCSKTEYKKILCIGEEPILKHLKSDSASICFSNHSFCLSNTSSIYSLMNIIRKQQRDTICCIALGLSFFTQHLDVSHGCKMYHCSESVSIHELKSSISKDLRQLVEIIPKLSNDASVVVLPLFPMDVFCDNASSENVHAISHVLTGPNVSVIQATTHSLKESLQFIQRNWSDLMHLGHIQQSSFPIIEKLNKLNFDFLPLRNDLKDFQQEWLGLNVWKTAVITIFDALVGKTKSFISINAHQVAKLPTNHDLSGDGSSHKKITSVKIGNFASSTSHKFLKQFISTIDPLAIIEEAKGLYEVKFSNQLSAEMIVAKLHNLRLGESWLKASISKENPDDLVINSTLLIYADSIFEKIYNSMKEKQIILKIEERIEKVVDVGSFKNIKCTGRHKKQNEIPKCPYYHDSSDRRRNPYEIKYRMENCYKDPCHQGDSCLKAHNSYELMFYPSNYQAILCPICVNGRSCPNKPACKFAHKDSPEMFFLPQWEDLLISGGENTINYLTGAMRGLNKLNITNKVRKIVLISPNEEFLTITQKSVARLAGRFNLKLLCCVKEFKNNEPYDVLLLHSSLLSKAQPALFIKGTQGAIVVDNARAVMESNPSGRILLKLVQELLRTKAEVNKVFICRELDPKLHKVFCQYLPLKLVDKETELSEFPYLGMSRKSTIADEKKSDKGTNYVEGSESKRVYRNSDTKLGSSMTKDEEALMSENSSSSKSLKQELLQPISIRRQKELSQLQSRKIVSPQENQQVSLKEGGIKDLETVLSEEVLNQQTTSNVVEETSKSYSKENEMIMNYEAILREQAIEQQAELDKMQKKTELSYETIKMQQELDYFSTRGMDIATMEKQARMQSTSKEEREKSVDIDSYNYSNRKRSSTTSEDTFKKSVKYSKHDKESSVKSKNNIDQKLENSKDYKDKKSQNFNETYIPTRHERKSIDPEDSFNGASFKSDGYNPNSKDMNNPESYEYQQQVAYAIPHCSNQTEDYNGPYGLSNYRRRSPVRSENIVKQPFQGEAQPEWNTTSSDKSSFPAQSHTSSTFPVDAPSTSSQSTVGLIPAEEIPVLRKSFGTDLFLEYKQELAKTKIDFDKEHKLYEELSDLHPDYNEYFGMFNSKYQQIYGTENTEHKQTFWDKFWKQKFPEISRRDWQNEYKRIKQEYEIKRKMSLNSTSNKEVTVQLDSRFSIPLAFDLLESISHKVGVLGPTLDSLVKSCKKLTKSKALDVINNDESTFVLKTVQDKLKNLKLSSNRQEAITYTVAIQWIDELSAISKNHDAHSMKLDVESIAKATIGKDHEFIVKMIKSALEYEGKCPSVEEVTEWFLKVCHLQFSMPAGQNNPLDQI